MAILVGSLIAIVIAVLATTVGWDRDRSFYAVVTLVVASYYALFAAMGASSGTIIEESLVAMAFVILAIVGFKKSLWLVMVALAGHGIFDIFHGMFISNPGMPTWWPGFCMSCDVLLGAYFAWQLKTKRLQS